MPKISEERREQRRAQIMAAAVRCFSRSGYHRTSMTDIIKESGLSAGAIYGYFSGKQDLIHAVARSVMEGRFSELSALSEGHVLTPAEIASNLIQGLRATLPTGMLLQVWSEATVDEELHAMFQELVGSIKSNVSQLLERWADVHSDEIDEDSASWAVKSAPVLIAVVVGFVLQSTLVTGFNDQQFLDTLPGLIKDTK